MRLIMVILYLLWLFCTCIRTDRVRKLFITSLMLNKVLCRKVQIPCLHIQQTSITMFFVMHCSFSTQPQAKTLSLLEVM